jgi:hypothetical protein
MLEARFRENHMAEDKRGRLEEEIFSYQITKDEKVLIYWKGKRVTILKGDRARKFISQIEAATDDHEAQLIMAKVTGNFKRGNERH